VGWPDQGRLWRQGPPGCSVLMPSA